MNAFGIDVSFYNEKLELKQGDVDFVCSRMGGTNKIAVYGDDTFPYWVQQAYNIGVPCIGYWVTSGYWLGNQCTMDGVTRLTDAQHPIYQVIYSAVKNRAVNGIAFDVEEPAVACSAGTVTPAWVAFYVRDLCDRLNKAMDRGELRRMRLGVYSRKGWMDQYGGDLSTWLGTQPEMFIWTAHYPGSTAIYNGGLSYARSNPPVDSFKPATFGWTASRVPADWSIWQYSGDAPGGMQYIHSNGHKYDCDLWHGDNVSLRQYFNMTTVPPIVVIPPDNSITLETVNSKLDALIARWDRIYK